MERRRKNVSSKSSPFDCHIAAHSLIAHVHAFELVERNLVNTFQSLFNLVRIFPRLIALLSIRSTIKCDQCYMV